MSKDHPDVQVFMSLFAKLRHLVDGDPEILVEEARQDDSLANLCDKLLFAAIALEIEERKHRELFSSSTNPSFIEFWRDYKANYSTSVHDVFFWVNFGSIPIDPKIGSSDEQSRWKEDLDFGKGTAEAIGAAIEHARVDIETNRDIGAYEEDYVNEIQSGIKYWKEFIDEMGFDLDGAMSRRQLLPFVLIPRHVANRYSQNDQLSLSSQLLQAQEAFVYGIPLASLALLRALLEEILFKFYHAGVGDLSEKISNAAKFLPRGISAQRLHHFRILGNDAVHVEKKKLHRIGEFGLEILSFLEAVRRLIEAAPASSAQT